MEEKDTIETITRSYEEKIANREKEFLLEKEQLKKDYEEQQSKLIEQHNKEIADIILGRKSIENIQDNDEEENDKSFFDIAVDNTKKKLKGGI